MELKKNIVYFYTVQRQLHIPINRYVYNLYSNAIDFFEKKKQDGKNYKYANNINYTLFTSSEDRIRKLHFLLEDFDSFRFIFIDGIYHYNNIFSLKKDDTREISYIYVPSGIFLKKPIEIFYVFTEQNPKRILFNPRIFIFLGKGSCVKIIERHKKINLEKEKFSSGTEVYMNTYSYVDYYKIQEDRLITYFLDHTCILQEDRSDCYINTFSFCGEIILNFLSIFQLGKEIHSHINSLSIFHSQIKHNTLIEHINPNGKSRDIYKGIYDKLANIKFNGKIIVLKSAKKTNATQQNTNILLANEAKVIANPQLEIFVEDVKCSHGCIVGQLNSQQIFYLRSRGILKTDVITKMLFAFAKNTLECLSSQELIIFFKKINKNVIHSRN